MSNKILIISVIFIAIIAILGVYFFVAYRQSLLLTRTQNKPSSSVTSLPKVQTNTIINDNLDQALKDLDLIFNK